MKTKKKISLIIPTLSHGGMERVMSELANYAVKDNYDVSIVFLIKHTPFYTLNSAVDIFYPRFSYKDNFLSKLAFKIYLLFYIRSKIKFISPDTVLSLPQKYNNLAIIALLGTRFPIFVSDRNNLLTNIGFGNELLRRFLYPYAKGIIAQTSFAKQVMLRKGIRNDNIKIIPNPLKAIVSKSKTDPGRNYVINIGRLSPEKNQRELIEIFSELNLDNWHMVILGDGPLRNELEDLILKLDMKNKIHLAGVTLNVDEWMAQSDIFAFTSLSEGFPNSLNEAMAYPLACISYDCDAGPRDLIQNGENGILVPINDREQYKTRLEELMTNEVMRDRLKKASLENRNKYSMNKIGQQFISFITAK